LYELIYLDPRYDDEVHERIIGLLEEIKKLHGIPWRKVVVRSSSWEYRPLDMSSADAYNTFIKPFARQIKLCLEILSSLGIDVLVETTSRKFRTRSRGYSIAGSLLLQYNGQTICALRYESEVLSFLETLQKEGQKLLEKLPLPKTRGRSTTARLTENDVLRLYVGRLNDLGYEVYVNVKHNMMAKEDPAYLFQPDADIIAIKDSTIIGIEVKGGKEGREPSLDQVYTGLGEALFYLVNPIAFKYNGKILKGGIFNKVYLLLPTLPNYYEDEIISLIESVKLVGLITLDRGVVVEPQPNPHLNREKKDALLRNKHVLWRYSTRALYWA